MPRDRRISLMLWCLISVISIMQFDAQNAQHRVKVLAFNGLPYAYII
jgi:hypothetical protein